MKKTGSKILHGMLLATSAMVASTVIVSTAAMANPAGGTVASGSATITNPSTTQTVINQSSQKALINWNSFNVLSGSSVIFNQPNSNSLTVNRVTGPGSSTINGSIFATGNIWLLNANGILFGKGAQINVGSLLATTSELSDADFKAGNNNFTASPNPNAAVINQGTITASRGGSVILSAPSVSNEGLIQADLGTVVLGGAQAFTVDMTGDNLLRYQISAPVTQTPTDSQGKPALALVSNSGTISANGGHVVMTARAAQSVQDNVINNTGMVEATSVSAHDGEIDLDAGPNGTANVGGTLDASGAASGQAGGTVTVTGGTVNVADGAKINASGSAGGGTVLIGGGPHGSGSLAHAQRTIIGAATITADATVKGNGGNVTVWSDGTTQFNGSISARGGAQGGNGGQVETSGNALGVSSSAKVDTSAPLGLVGDWLLDPTEVDIASCGSSCGSTEVISPISIEGSLENGDVTIDATSLIHVESALTYTSSYALNLLSKAEIIVGANIQNSGSGNINLVAGWDGVTTDPANFTNSGVYGSGTGEILFNNTSGSVAVGTESGVTTLAGGAIDIGVGLGGTQQVGYKGAGGGDIRIVSNNNIVLDSDDHGTVIIGNGVYGCATGAVTGDVSITTTGSTSNLQFTPGSGAISVGNGEYENGGSVSGAVSGDLSLNVGGALQFGSGAVQIGNNGGTSTSGDVTIVAGSLSESGTAFENDVYNDLANGDVTLGFKGPFTLDVGGTFSRPHNFTLLSTGALTIDASLQNTGDGAITLIGGWNGTTTDPSQLTNAGAYGASGGNVTFASGVSVGSAQGAIIVAGYDVNLGVGTTGTDRIGYTGVGTGDIDVLATNNLLFAANVTGTIGNGAGTGTVGGDIALNVTGAITYGAAASVTIGNSGGAGTTSGDLTITTGTLNLPNTPSIIDTDIALGDVSVTFTDQTSTGFGALSYNSPHNLTIASTGNLTLSNAIDNSGCGTVSLTAGGTDFGNNAGTLTIGADITTAGTGGTDIFQAGDTIDIDGNISVGGDRIFLHAGQSTGDSTAGAILDPNGKLLTADTISIQNDKGGTADQTVGTALAPLDVETSHLAIITATDDIYVNATGDIDLGDGFNGITGNSFTLTASGNVTQNSEDSLGLQVGNLNVTTTGDDHSILLTGGEEGDLNEVYGAVVLSSAADASFTNSETTLVNGITAAGVIDVEVNNDNQDTDDNGDAELIIHGAIDASGTGQTTLHAAGSIVNDPLTDPYGAFNGDTNPASIDTTITADQLSLVSDNGSVSGSDPFGDTSFFLGTSANAIHAASGADGGITISNNKSFVIGIEGDGTGLAGGTGGGYIGAAVGDITQLSGADGAITGSNLSFGATGTFTLDNVDNAVSGTLTLYSHTGGSVSFTNSGATEIGDIAEDLFDTSTVGGDVTLTVLGGPLSQSDGGAIYAANLTINMLSGNDSTPPVTLLNAANDVTGTFSVITPGDVNFKNSVGVTLGDVNGGNVTIYGCGTPPVTELESAENINITALSGGINVAGIVVGTDLLLTAVGDITQSNAITANYADIETTGSGNIVLTNAGNQIDAATLTSGGNASLYDGTDLTLSGASAAGNVTLLTTGNLTLAGSVQLSSGSILAVAGWDGSTAPTAITANSTAYGQNGGSILFGGEGDVYVGSNTGTTSVYGYDVTIDANYNTYQLGYKDRGTGAINVQALDDITVSASGCGGECGDAAVIGDGNTDSSRNASANITLNAGHDISLSGSGGSAEIGNQGGGNVVNGTINITAGGNVSVSGFGDGYAQIGNYGNDSGIKVGGDIFVTANGTGGVNLTTGGEGYGAQIGNGAQGDGAKVGGNITVTANNGGVSLNGDGLFEQTLIGNYGFGGTDPDISGDIVVAAKGGDVELDAADTNATVQIGNSGSAGGGTMGGNITVTSSGNIDLTAEDDGAIAQIGNGGTENEGPVSGNINVTAAGHIFLTASTDYEEGDEEGAPGYAHIGNGDLTNQSSGNVSGDIYVQAGGLLQFDANNGTTWLGNIGGSDEGNFESGNVTVIAGSENDEDAAEFGVMLAADIGSSYLASSGGNIFVGLTDPSHVKIGGVDYDSGKTLTLAMAGNVTVTGDIRNDGAGALNVIGGWDGTTTALASLTDTGVYGNNDGDVTIGGTGSVSVGSAQGHTTVEGANITLSGANGTAQIGYAGSGGGDITVLASHDIIMTAGDCTDCDVQIGDGWVNDPSNNGGESKPSITESGNIVVNAGGNISLTAGAEAYAYAQIGNGGDSSNGTFGGNINVTAGGALSLLGSVDYAQIGNAGWGANGNASGNITVNVTGDINITSGNGGYGYAKIGHGGESLSDVAENANYTGNIFVTSGDTITLTAADDGEYAQIGHGSGQYANNSADGNITVRAAGLTLTGSGTSNADNFVEIGNTAEDGTATGNISICVTGTSLIKTSDGDGDVWIGNHAADGGSSSGSVTLISGDYSTSNDDNDDTSNFLLADLSGGAVTFGITDADAHLDVGGLNYSSAYALTILTAGDLEVVGNIQNAGTGDITIATGWNPSVAPANIATAGAYGNNGATLTIGGADALGSASVGSAGGTTTVLTGNLVVDADTGIAQLGYSGTGTGAISVTALDDVTVETEGNWIAQIGNGGLNATGAIGGNISINAANVFVDTDAAFSIAEIGNVGGAGSDQGGNITVNATASVSLATSAANSSAQIGNAEIGISDPGVYGNATGNISISAPLVTVNATAAKTSAQIGNGSSLHYNSNVSGNVTVSAGTLLMNAQGIDGEDASSDSLSQALIGNDARNAESGAIAVNVTGHIQMNATSAGDAVIGGESLQGSTGGNITATAGDYIALQANNARSHTFIGHSGSNAGGNVTVNAFNGLQLNAAGANSTASIGDVGTGTFSGNISAASANGSISVSATGSNATAGIGLATEENGDSANGTVSVTALNITANASGHNSLADFGTIAFGGNASSNVTVNATQILTLASSNSSLAEIGDLSEGGTATGTVNVTAASLSTGGLGEISGTSANIVITGAGQNVGSDETPLLLAVNNLSLQTNNGSAYLASPAQGLSIGVGEGGIVLGTGSLTLSADGPITQTAAIEAASLNVSTTSGDITLTNSGNAFENLTVGTAGSNNASLKTSGSLTLDGGSVGGTLTLTAASVDQDGAISADALAVTASDGDIDLGDTDNVIATASLNATGNATLTDNSDLTIAGATVGGNLTLIGGSIDQSGAISADSLSAGVESGDITLTNDGNAFNSANVSATNVTLFDSKGLAFAGGASDMLTITSGGSVSQSDEIYAPNLAVTALNGDITLDGALNVLTNVSLNASGNASVNSYDNLRITHANVGGTLTLTSDGYIAQSSAIEANSLVATASDGDISLTDNDNKINSASLRASGNATLYDTNSLVITGANANGDLTLLSTGNLTIAGTAQAQNGNVLAVAGWDGTTTDASALASNASSYGNNGGDVIIDGVNDASLGSFKGETLVEADNVMLNAGEGYAQIGYAGGNSSGAIAVVAKGNVTLSGGNAYAQIGNGGEGNEGGASGAISVSAGGDVLLQSGDAIQNYAQIGDGGFGSQDGTVTGDIVVNATNVILASDEGYTQIGDGGAQSGGDNSANITINASGNVTLTGGGVQTWGYAQIGNGGDSSNGTDTGNIAVTAGGDIALTGGGDYAQIGNGGWGSAGAHSGAITIAATGNVTVQGGNVDSFSYAQIGNGGESSVGDDSGDISITAGNNLNVVAGSNGLYAQIGNGADINGGNTDVGEDEEGGGGGNNSSSGNITLTVGGNLTANGGTSEDGAGLSQYAQIGNTAFGGTASGNIVANVAGTTDIVSYVNGGGVRVGNRATGEGGTESGDVTFASGVFNENDDALDEAGQSISADLSGGNVTLDNLGTSTFAFGDVEDVNSAYDLKIASGGDIVIAGTIQNAGSGNITLASNGTVTIGGAYADGSVAVGSAGGNTVITAEDVVLSAINGYAQIGYQGGGSGAIIVNATGDITLNGGSNTAYFAQIGDGGYQVSGSNSGAVSVLANGNVTLNAGSGQEAYAQIGNGGAESNSNSEGYTDTGDITVHGAVVALNAGSGNASYVQIGNGGYKSGQGLSGVATVGGDIEVDAVSAVTLNGNAMDAYAQIGNGGDFINSNNTGSGTIGGDITVAVSSPATAGNAITAIAGSGADSYAQIGDGGNGENTPASGNAVTFTVGGNITINDLVLTGSNSGANGYAQIGNGDNAGTGSGNVSGNIVFSDGTQFFITPGTASGSGANINNDTGSGTVSGTVTGYNGGNPPPPPPPKQPMPTSDPTTAGAVSNTIQNSSAPTTYTFTEVVVTPQFGPDNGDLGVGTSTEPTPLEKLAGDVEGENGSSDSLTQAISDGKTHTATRTLIPGVLQEIITLTPRNPHGVPPADEDYSSWGNEALWRW